MNEWAEIVRLERRLQNSSMLNNLSRIIKVFLFIK